MKHLFSVIMILCLAVISIAGDIKPELSDKAVKKLVIEMTDDLVVNADIENIPLEDVLKEIEKKADIKMNIFDKSLLKRKVTLSLKNREIEFFIKAVVGENHVFVFKKVPNKKKYILTEVGVANKSLKPSNRIITKEISYGSGKENIGSVRAGEGANMGPASFTIDAHGNIYICDTVNNRIQKFSSDGKYLSSVQLKGQMPQDISIDKNGFLYVYDAEGKLYQYDSNGTSVGDLDINETRWDSRGPMHIINDEVYVRGSGRGDVLVAKIENGKLIPPSDDEFKKPLEEGIYGLSGKRYIAVLKEEDKQGGVEVVDRNGTKSGKVFPLEGIVSVEFQGEDGKGNSYVKTEADRNGEIFVEVSKFNANGDYVNTIPIPGMDYSFWAVKSLSVGEDGTIYHMMPGKDKVTLNTFPTN